MHCMQVLFFKVFDAIRLVHFMMLLSAYALAGGCSSISSIRQDSLLLTSLACAWAMPPGLGLDRLRMHAHGVNASNHGPAVSTNQTLRLGRDAVDATLTPNQR